VFAGLVVLGFLYISGFDCSLFLWTPYVHVLGFMSFSGLVVGVISIRLEKHIDIWLILFIIRIVIIYRIIELYVDILLFNCRTLSLPCHSHRSLVLVKVPTPRSQTLRDGSVWPWVTDRGTFDGKVVMLYNRKVECGSHSDIVNLDFWRNFLFCINYRAEHFFFQIQD